MRTPPTASCDELDALFRGYGYTPYFVEGDDPDKMHHLMAATLDVIVMDIQRSTKSEIFETGIKVIDVLVPLEKGGKAGLFGERRSSSGH